MNRAKEKFEYVFTHFPKSSTIRCYHCGSPVLTSDAEGCTYQRLNCNEDLYKIEVYEGINWTVEELAKVLLWRFKNGKKFCS